MMNKILALLFIAPSASVGKLFCDKYEDLASSQAQQLDPRHYQGIWHEVASANVVLTKGCQCTYYNFTLTSDTEFSDVFTCHKNSPAAEPTVLPNHGSFSADLPGKMVESLGLVSPPYWVLEVWGDYEYSLVYACVPVVGEYVYFLSRTPDIPEVVRSQMNAYATKNGISLSAVKEVPMDGCSFNQNAAALSV